MRAAFRPEGERQARITDFTWTPVP
jgi:hypothetical protein